MLAEKSFPVARHHQFKWNGRCPSFKILVHCSREWWVVGAADRAYRTRRSKHCSPAQSPRAKGCPAAGSSLFQLSWPSWPALPRSLHNWLKLPLAASPRPPSRSGAIPQQPTFHLRRRNPPDSSSPHQPLLFFHIFSTDCFFCPQS